VVENNSYTVDTHRKNLLAKFEVSNTALLITTAVKFGVAFRFSSHPAPHLFYQPEKKPKK
jgi:hypothetical protein